MRWLTIAALLIPALAESTTGRLGLMSWALVLLFAGYNLLAELLGNRVARATFAPWWTFLDLPTAGLVYFLGGRAGGPLLILVAMVVLCAAVRLTLRGTLVYTAAAAAMITAIETTFPSWSWAAGDVGELGARIVGLGLIGVGMTLIARRLSLEQAAARSRRDEAERLAELDRLRADFIATVSHDLRTPLTAVQAGLGLLEANASHFLPPAERTLLGNARQNAERLGRLIDDLIAVNQLESGILHLEHRRVDLRATLTEAVGAVHPLLMEKTQTLELDVPGPLPVEGDPLRLEQAVLNVLVNAHQHTPAGTRIRVSARLGVDEVILSVRDDGPGVPAEHLEDIFRRFHRLTGHGGGSGLGLAIARGIVEAHGGRIWAESGRGEGSAFHLCLPVRPQNTGLREGSHVPEAARR